ncbi:hypothetical protein [Maridesulfovibrio sp.]|uniref:hypothetical protein n=1 Tax=Maridesulfovibrio sp. TaxID=2795000 RepID=UPI0039EF4DD5
MQRLAKQVDTIMPAAVVNLTAPNNAAPKVLIKHDGVMVKIEPNAIRAQLVQGIKSGLSDNDKLFLLSVKKGKPKWDLPGILHTAQLSADLWKLHNIEKLRKNAKKHAEAVRKLE